MDEKKTVYIAVMNYRTAEILLYKTELSADYQSEEVEYWLYDNTDYSDSDCYYMTSDKPIPVVNA